MKTIVLIPAYNEEKTISAVVSTAREYLPVWVVDDGSGDGTADRALEAGAVVIRQSPNKGKGAALRLGFEKALQEDVDALIMLDADGQHDPLEIPGFLQTYEETKADLIIGARDFRHMPFTRWLANTSGRALLSWSLGSPIRDNQSGYRMLNRRMMQSALESQEGGYEFEVDMLYRCIRNGWKMEWTPIKTIYAGEKSHIHVSTHVRNFLRLVLKYRRERLRRDAW